MKNGFFKIALGLVAIVLVTSCSKEEDSNLSISFSDRPVLIPSQSASCSQIMTVVGTTNRPAADVQGKYFSLRTPIVNWVDLTDSVQVEFVKIEVKSNLLVGGKYECLLSGDELSNVFADLNFATDTQTGLPVAVVTPWDGVLAHASKVGENVVASTRGTNAACPFLRCGGVQIVEGKDRPFEVTGTLQIFGVATKASDKSEYPVKTTTSVTLINDI